MRTFCPQIGVDVNEGFSMLICSFPGYVLKNCEGENGSVFTGVCFSAVLLQSLNEPSLTSLPGDWPTRILLFFLRMVGGVLNLATFGDVKGTASEPLFEPLQLFFFFFKYKTDIKLAFHGSFIVLNSH